MKNILDFVVPMLRTAAQAVECPFQQPEFVVLGFGIADGRFDDCNLVWWQNSLAEHILTITLLNSLTPKSAPVGTKNSHSEDFLLTKHK